MNSKIIFKSELEHHGILGQKHGVRNGPPYPLAENVSKAVKASAKTVSSSANAGRQAAIGKTSSKIANAIVTKNGKLDAKELVAGAVTTFAAVTLANVMNRGANAAIDAAIVLGKKGIKYAKYGKYITLG